LLMWHRVCLSSLKVWRGLAPDVAHFALKIQLLPGPMFRVSIHREYTLFLLRPPFWILDPLGFFFCVPNFCMNRLFRFSIHRDALYCLSRPFGFSTYRALLFFFTPLFFRHSTFGCIKITKRGSSSLHGVINIGCPSNWIFERYASNRIIDPDCPITLNLEKHAPGWLAL
jgi:hypothetical protein